jgi:hypothetical protein
MSFSYFEERLCVDLGRDRVRHNTHSKVSMCPWLINAVVFQMINGKSVLMAVQVAIITRVMCTVTHDTAAK